MVYKKEGGQVIQSEYFWFNVIALSLGTFVIRASLILLSSKLKISNRAKEIFTFIPAAILPALVAPMVYFHKGQVDWVLGKERLLVLILATLFCYYTKSMVVTITVGLSLLYALTYY